MELVEVGLIPGPGHTRPGPVGAGPVLYLPIGPLLEDALHHQEVMVEIVVVSIPDLAYVPPIIDAPDQVHGLLPLPTDPDPAIVVQALYQGVPVRYRRYYCLLIGELLGQVSIVCGGGKEYQLSPSLVPPGESGTQHGRRSSKSSLESPGQT